MDDRLFEIQRRFDQFEKVPVCHPVFGHAVTCGVIGVDIPFIFIFGIRNIAFDIESRFHPFLNDLGRNPETSQLEINVFDSQRFRLHSLQCGDILRCQFAGDLQLADHVSAQVCALEFNLFADRFFKKLSGLQQLTPCLVPVQFHHFGNIVNIDLVAVSV